MDDTEKKPEDKSDCMEISELVGHLEVPADVSLKNEPETDVQVTEDGSSGKEV